MIEYETIEDKNIEKMPGNHTFVVLTAANRAAHREHLRYLPKTTPKTTEPLAQSTVISLSLQYLQYQRLPRRNVSFGVFFFVPPVG